MRTDRIVVRLATLSPEARVALERAGNRSEYVRRAIEHYATGGQAVVAALERIEARLAGIEARLANLEGGVAAPPSAPVTTEAGVEAVARALDMARAWVDE